MAFCSHHAPNLFSYASWSQTNPAIIYYQEVNNISTFPHSQTNHLMSLCFWRNADKSETSETGKSVITSVKLASELGKTTFSTGKPKLTQGEVLNFQEF